MRIAVLLPNHAPHFGRAWATAASDVADVLTIDFVKDLSLPKRAPGVAGEGSSYQVQRIDLRPARFLQPVSSRLLGRRLQRAIDLAAADHGPIDLLHTHYYHQTHALPHLPRPVPYVHTEHSLAMLRGLLGDDAHYPLSPQGLAMARQAFAGARRVLAVSEFLARSMEALDLPGGPFRVVPNPIDTERFQPGEAVDPLRLVSVGRLSPDKQPDVVLRAFAQVARERPELQLTMIGAGPMADELRSLAAQLGVAAQVELAGRLSPDGVAAHLREAGCYLNAAKVETFSVAIAEALACGVPVVASDTSAIPELVDERNGVLTPPGDPEAMAAGIREVLDRSYDRAAISRAISDRCSMAAVGAQLADVYEAAIERR